VAALVTAALVAAAVVAAAVVVASAAWQSDCEAGGAGESTQDGDDDGELDGNRAWSGLRP
jgi:opacity protein-like surface antigen